MVENSGHSGHRERMRARFRNTMSIDGLAEHEVLEMLLYNLIPRADTSETARRLLAQFGNIRCVLSADVTELAKIDGVGLKCAEQLVFTGQVFRLAEKESLAAVRADDFNSLSEYLRNYYCGDKVERLCAFAVNGAGTISGSFVLSVGVSDRVAFNVEELKRFLLDNNTSTLLLTHNHPLGTAQPSQEDMMITRRIQTMLGNDIRLLDHIIVGAEEVVSMRSVGALRSFE